MGFLGRDEAEAEDAAGIGDGGGGVGVDVDVEEVVVAGEEFLPQGGEGEVGVCEEKEGDFGFGVCSGG